MNKASWFVYIIQTVRNRLYTGITTDVERRFQEHKGDLPRGAKFFRSDKPEKIVYLEPCETRSAALIREAQIKKLSRAQKNSLIEEKTTKARKNG